ncbi:MAG: rod shape-determining protein MreD [Lactobacillaceae bacterium]|jgi:rod shape-determining protein MreD|nr:rod shape-determining protein MreD [Lactobacillaceae bacterium]
MYQSNYHRRVFVPKLVLPILLFLSFLLDGINNEFFSSVLNLFGFQILPNLFLVFIFYILRFRLKKEFNFYIWILIIGIIFDLYFSLSIGIYLFSYLISAFIMEFIDKKLENKIYNSWITAIVGLTSFYLFAYFGILLISHPNQTFVQYFIFTFIPTILFNTVLTYIFYKPALAFSYWLVP